MYLFYIVFIIFEYTNSLISDLISDLIPAWTNYISEQLLGYLENKGLFVTCFVKINEDIIEIRQKTSDISKSLCGTYLLATLALFFNEVLESLIIDSNECTLAFNYCCNIFL